MEDIFQLCSSHSVFKTEPGILNIWNYLVTRIWHILIIAFSIHLLKSHNLLCRALWQMDVVTTEKPEWEGESFWMTSIKQV